MGKKSISELGGAYDVIVGGGGLGGLTAANVLARGGCKVLLAEQHSELGGLASYFRRRRHIFDVALHGFPIGMKKTLRKYWGTELSDRIIQVRSVRFDNPQFSLETTFTREDFTEILSSKFKVPREKADLFYDELDRMNFYDDSSRTNRELFDRHFPGRNDIVRLLMEPITYANGSNLDEPAITYGIVFSNFMSKGVYTFLGGTDLMIRLMEKELEKNGVDIVTRAQVQKAIIENGRCAGAVIGGRPVGARAVLSNGNILSTIYGWAGKEHFRKDFLEMVSKVRLNNSSCQVYIGLGQGEKFDFVGDLLFTSEHPVFDPAAILSKDVSSRTFSIYYPDIRPGSEDYTIVASMNARYEDWAGLAGAEYAEAKKRLIARTLDSLEKYIPGVKGKIDYAEAATPLTFERYTLHRGGSSFGTKFEGLEASMKLSEQIPGLYHSGSVGIIMSGWLGAANYGVITANNIQKYLDKN